MNSLLDLLTQRQPQFQTHQALIVLGLQNDFLAPDGKLPVSTESGFLKRILTLVPKFRERAGDIIWVRSEYEADRAVNDGAEGGEMVVTDAISLPDGDGESVATVATVSTPKEPPTETPPPTIRKKSGRSNKKKALDLFKRIGSHRKSVVASDPDAAVPVLLPIVSAPPEDSDEELFLTASKKGPCCLPSTPGASFPPDVKAVVDEKADIMIVNSHYSAFNDTSLLMMLRTKLITEVFICGCITNLSVYATALDAARHGVTINIIEDCLGYRTFSRHDAALKVMTHDMGVYTLSSIDILADLDAPVAGEEQPKGTADVDAALDAAMSRLGIKNEPGSPSKPRSKDRSVDELTAALSTVSVGKGGKGKGKSTGQQPEEQRGLEVDVENKSELLTANKSLRSYRSQPDVGKQYVKSRIRMRPKGDGKKPGPPGASARAVAPTDTDTKPAVSESSQDAPIKVQDSAKAAEESKDDKSAASHPAPESSTAAESKGATGPTSKDTERPEEPSDAPQSSQSKTKGRAHRVKGAKSSPSLKSTVSTSSSDQPPPPLPQPQPASKLTSSASAQSPESPALPQNPKPSKTATKAQSESVPTASASTPTATAHSIPTSTAPTPSASAPTAPTPSSPPPTTSMSRRKPLPSLANLPTLGPNDAIGSADSCIQHTLLPPTLRDPTNPSLPLSSTIFHALYHSIPWQTMHHAGGPVPRLVAAQAQPGTPDDPTAVPVYRHPSDRAPKSEPFSRWVKLVREHAEVAVGHPLNHVLIQLYRGGEDYISEHSDKTLDVVRGSSIVNVSFGAQRTMRLRRKKAPSTKEDVAVAGTELEKEDAAVGAPRETQRVVLPHNSLFVLGPRTNQFWLHAIGADKRAAAERSEEEKAYEGMRISLTFRQIGTFLSADGKLIWGQGATKKTRNEARRVVVGDEEQTERMVRAFGVENRLAEGFDWGKTYGDGFDVLHFREEDEEGY